MQGAKDLPTDNTSFIDNELSIDAKKFGISYKGKFEYDTIKGTFSQGGASMPLILSRKKEGESILKRPQTPQPPFNYNIEDVAFTNPKDKNTLAGTLTAPSDKKDFPVVVLISGSGQQNRNSEIFGHKEFWVIADDFAKAMNDDLAVPQALAFIAESMRIGNSAGEDKKVIAKSAGEIRGALSILGCDPKDAAFATSKSNDAALDGLIKLALEQREAARLRKDFATADQIRDQIAALGITVEDTSNGPRWSY